MIDQGDKYKRVVCDVCERPFNPKRVIPVPPICIECRQDAQAEAGR
ncbi:hypothetical protein [Rhodococcus sp. SORGH_AS_0303]|nr:hypothetical protein [Rhodococcus sp. SORGH_AS_0303]MDQ1202830.1 formylmethanofuran dehydrogenase subunit E [Rhodococcus sp. SORGH_AS_0303]